MLADISVNEAKVAVFGKEGKPRRLGRNDILKALSKYGLKPATEKAVSISSKNRLIDLSGHALIYARALALDKDGDYVESHHWLVWDGKACAVRDPLGFLQPLKLTSYTEIK